VVEITKAAPGVPPLEHRASTESSSAVEKAKFGLAGAEFHSDPIFAGQGSPQGGPSDSDTRG